MYFFILYYRSLPGFGVLTNHPIDWKLVEEVYEEWRVFLSEQEELWIRGENKYLFSQDTQDGFFPMSRAESAKGQTVKDMKHYFHLYFPHGRYPHEVSDKARQLFDQMYKLGIDLLGWIWDHMDEKVKQNLLKHRGLDREKFTLCDTASMTRTLLRVLHYPAYKDGEEEPGAVRAAAHEDINLITVLPAGSSRGLQVLLNKNATSQQIQGGEGTPVATETSF